MQLLAPVVVALQKDLPVFPIFLSEHFGSAYFIKGDLSALGDGVYLCSLLTSSEIKGMFLQCNSKQSTSQGKVFYLKSD